MTDGQATAYVRWFGALYCLDGLLGLATGSGYLDLLFLHGMLDLPFTTRVLMNLTHIAIGGFAAFKGAYESTVGHAFERLRGHTKTAEDEFAARDMHTYAEFLRQTPWYEYPFGWRLLAFWRSTLLRGAGLARKIERRVVFTLDYGTKAVYGALIGYASGAALGAADLEIQTVIVGLEPGDAAREPRMRIVRELGGGRTLIRTPRYQAYTDLLVRLARRGRDVAEIAGNHRILVTVLAPPDPLPPVPGVAELFEAPIQSRPDRRRLGLDVSVEHLAAAIIARAAHRHDTDHDHDHEPPTGAMEVPARQGVRSGTCIGL